MRSRLLATLPASALIATSCGGGESNEDRRAVVEMLERLGQDPGSAQCMAEEFGGEITVAQLQTMIDARDDFTSVDFEPTEQVASAQITCKDDD